MPNYRWTCHGCSTANEPALEYCSRCGLSATATPEEIALHSIPGAYKKKKTIERYQKDLFIFIMVPFFCVTYALHGRIEALLFILVGLVFIVQKNTELLGHVWANKWASYLVLLWSGVITSMMALRITVIPDDSKWVGYSTAFIFVFQCAMYFYLFKSKKAKTFFGRYYDMANK